MKITVCIGSSCHIKGSRSVVEQLQYLHVLVRHIPSALSVPPRSQTGGAPVQTRSEERRGG